MGEDAVAAEEVIFGIVEVVRLVAVSKPGINWYFSRAPGQRWEEVDGGVWKYAAVGQSQPMLATVTKIKNLHPQDLISEQAADTGPQYLSVAYHGVLCA